VPKHLIEQELPGAQDLSSEDLRAVSQKSNEVQRKAFRPWSRSRAPWASSS